MRALVEEGTPAEIVLLNNPGGHWAEHVLLLEFDSAPGRWPAAGLGR